MKGFQKPKKHVDVAKTVDTLGKVVDTASTIMDFISILSGNPSKAPQHNHGPLVKTGPTAGRNRSRNKNGRWRAKRSDFGMKRK